MESSRIDPTTCSCCRTDESGATICPCQNEEACNCSCCQARSATRRSTARQTGSTLGGEKALVHNEACECHGYGGADCPCTKAGRCACGQT